MPGMQRLPAAALAPWILWGIVAGSSAGLAAQSLARAAREQPLPVPRGLRSSSSDSSALSAAAVPAPAPAATPASMPVAAPTPAPAAPTFVPDLLSADFVPGLRVRPGDLLSYALRFVNRGTEPAARNQPVFVHFEPLGQGCSAIAFQQDHELRLSTDMWQPGEPVLDGPRIVDVPLETAPGEYQVHVGIFDRDGTGKRSFDRIVATLHVDPDAPPSSQWKPEPLPEERLIRARAALHARLADPVVLDDPLWSFALDRRSGAFLLEDKRSGIAWSSDPDSTEFGRVRWRRGERSLDLGIERFDSIENTGRALLARRAFGEGDSRGSVELRVAHSPDTSGLRLSFTTLPPPGWELETLTALERAFLTTDSDHGATLAPAWLGQLKPADAGLPCERWFGGDDVSMSMSGALKQGSALLLAWPERDASLVMQASLEDSPLVAGRRAQSLGLVLGPRAREVELEPLGPGGYAEIGRAYKAFAEARGLRRTWAQKLARDPALEQLAGAPEFRFACLSRLAPSTRHNPSSATISRVDTTFEEAARCARHWHDDLGIERAQVLLAGWNRGGYDNGHPDVLPANAESGGDAGLVACAAAVQKLGYVFTLHDNYVDLYPDAPSWDPELVVRGKRGELVPGGEWLGGRAYRVCGRNQLMFARRNLPRIRELCAPQAIFLDSTLTSRLQACTHPAHPLEWWQDQEQRLELFRYAHGALGLVGLEGGREWAVADAHWFEGMLTQKTVHRKEWIIAPVFLFAYGDCIELEAMQADKLRPRDARKLLDLMLCGQMPSCSFGSHAYFEDVQADALPVVPRVAKFEGRNAQEFRLLLEWNVQGDLHEDCRVFVHFTRPGAQDREGIVFQGDHDPAVPSSHWRAGETRRTGGLLLRIPESESEEDQWEVRVGLARDGLRRPLATPDADEGLLTVGVLHREDGRLSLEPAASTADACFARADGGWAQGLLSTDRMIKNSYEVLSPLNRLVVTRGMTGHRFLARDRSVEQSVFGDVTVTANFGEQEFVLGETTLPQYGFLVESPSFVAFHATRRGALEYPGGALFALRALGPGKVRVFHGFGDAHVACGGRIFEVARETVLDASLAR